VRKSKALARDQAIRRGLAFIYRTACDAEIFKEWNGHGLSAGYAESGWKLGRR
jgi:hypothetical protein